MLNYYYSSDGRLVSITHNNSYTDTDSILERNPFRYRGYYYDAETGWYYLQSRYYDPEVKRFINADTPNLLTNDCLNLMQYNLFMYCNGDPVNYSDRSGHIAVVDDFLVVSFLIAVIAVTISGFINNIVSMTSEYNLFLDIFSTDGICSWLFMNNNNEDFFG